MLQSTSTRDSFQKCQTDTSWYNRISWKIINVCESWATESHLRSTESENITIFLIGKSAACFALRDLPRIVR